MFLNLKIILFSLFVVSVLSLEQRIHRNNRGIPVQFRHILKRAIDENLEITSTTPESTESTTEAVTEATKAPVDEVPKEEVKDETKEALDVRKEEGERIEREGEDSDRPITPSTPREVEATTPHTPTPLPPVTRPTVPSVPSVTLPTVPATRPAYPFQPTFPTNNFPNYWENPNWGNWGRYVPTHTANWPQQWPQFSWPSVPSGQQIPTYNPSIISTARYSPGSFAMIPSSGVPTFSFIAPQNPYPGAGRGFQYPGSRPVIPTYSGFQPGSGYQPRFIPSGGQTPGYYPGIGGGNVPGYYPSFGGQTPGYQPGFGGQTPGFQPGYGGQTPGFQPGFGGRTPGHQPGNGGQGPSHYPGIGGQSPPPQQPGADPNRPLGPMGPEFNDPDVTMIDGRDTNQPGSNAGRGYPGKVITIDA